MLNVVDSINAFQRAGFALALSASQSFGDGVYNFCQRMQARRMRDIRIEPT
jgi:hypothetical protein